MANIETAAGYQNDKLAGYVGTKFDPRMQKALYATTCLPQITTTSYFSQLTNWGDKVVVTRQPKVNIRPYVKGGKYLLESGAEEPFSLTLDKGAQWSHFYDDATLNRTHVKTLIPELLDSARSQTSEYMETEVFGWVPDKAPAYNTGAAAGKQSKKFNLGTADSPVSLNSKNSVPFMMQFMSVLKETNLKVQSRDVAIIIPEIVAYHLKANEKLLDASVTGTKSSLMTQYLEFRPAIGQIYVSNLLNDITNGSGVFPILCLAKEAVAFAAVAKDAKVVEPYDMHGKFARGYVLYGYDVAREEGIAVGYVQASAPDLTTT
jgi:hypothetical protein